MNTKSSLLVAFSALFIFSIIFYGCKKEDPLTPNEDMEKFQTEDYAGGTDIGGGFGDTTGIGGGGTDTSGNGGGVVVNEYFTVEIDGVPKSFNNPSFNFGNQIVNNSLSLDDQIQITRFSGFSVDTFDYPTIGYFKGQASYESVDGRLIIDSLTADFIKGTFYCKVVRTTGSDTISLTNGSFKVAK